MTHKKWANEWKKQCKKMGVPHIPWWIAYTFAVLRYLYIRIKYFPEFKFQRLIKPLQKKEKHPPRIL